MQQLKWFLVALTVVAAFRSRADMLQDQLLFRQILLSEVRKDFPAASAQDIAHVHYVGDRFVENALQAESLPAALQALHSSDLLSLLKRTTAVGNPVRNLGNLSTRRPLTLVLVPGVFGEFIKTRAFEEVLAQPSPLRDQFQAQVAADPQAVDKVVELKNWKLPQGFASTVESLAQRTETGAQPVRLDEVINMGEFQVQGQTVRVILFFTKSATLESLGRAQDVAAIFNRRLENYLRITGDQDMAFIGYSRGTVLGLEMLTQAQAANKPWLKNVRAMISLSGVVWGSSLADDVTDNAASYTHQIIDNLVATSNSLSYAAGNSSWFNDPNQLLNDGRWLSLLATASTEYVRGLQIDIPQLLQQLPVLAQVNPISPLGIAQRMWGELGLTQFEVGYNDNVDRFRYFVSQLLGSVNELATSARLQWWKTHNVPRDMTYYAITATMANPQIPAEKPLFDSALGYAGGSYDDISLLQNHLSYEKLPPGLALNDSQVSVAQAAFIPGVIASLNPANAGLHTKFLGVAGTHHWGMALREVNEMRSGTSINGYPRAAMLRALATQILLDER